ncbi:MAG: PEP-utilizing enzyme, partial [Candidatus Calescibacterium sp.]|nr:PEP-utilizing enzyme [Candidatus Calescibacterium sp.]
LVEISLKIEKIYQKPVDIEFCIKKNNIYILQVRYITTIKLGNYRIWDNSNIVESYPGITTPLTFSFIRIAYSSVYKQFCEIMSVDKQTILQNRYLFDSMLGFIHNRVYYNLLNWYELLMLLPGFNNNKEFMEQMMGVKQKLTKPLTPKKYNPINLLIVSIKMIINFVFLNSKIKKFLNEFNNVYDNYLKIKKSNKLSNMETHELFEIYKELEEKILFNWKAPILNDLYVMIFFGLLKKLNKKWKLPENIHTKLLSQTGEIKTTIFMEELIKITKKIRETNLDQFFIQSTTENLLQHYNNYKNENNDNPELNMIFQEIENYINLYGSRVIGELKLETKTLEENPTYLFTLIKNYLSNYSNIGNKNTDNTEEDIKTFGKQLKGIKYFIYKWVLTKAKETMKNREDQRFARSLAYSIVRDIVKTIANNWMKKGIIENKDDIFFLEWNEIWDYTFGKSSLHNIINLIKVRKQEFENSKNIELPDRFETYNEVYYNLNFSKFEEEKEALKGITACPGKTKGKVKIVKDIDEIENLLKTLNGEILVAKYTDPGWTLLFPSISGLIIEKGSVLSHTAIVAREMGIPTIVGVKNATSILKDENIVELNATNGTITIIN